MVQDDHHFRELLRHLLQRRDALFQEARGRLPLRSPLEEADPLEDEVVPSVTQ